MGATANALKAQLRAPAGHSNDFQPGLLKGEGVEVHQLAAGVRRSNPLSKRLSAQITSRALMSTPALRSVKSGRFGPAWSTNLRC